MRSPPDQPQRILELLDAVYPSFALLAGMELGLFSLIGDASLNLEELAARLDVREDHLGALVYTLVVAGLLVESGGAFCNSAEAQKFLVRGSPDYLGDQHGLLSNNWKRILDTAAMIRSGNPLAKYDYQSGHAELESILSGLHPGSVRDARLLLDRYDFSDRRSLLDIGGGTGGLATTLAEAYPDLQATVLDLPSVIPITRKYIESSGMQDRVRIATADAVRQRLDGNFDLVLARHLFQVLSSDENRALLQNLADAVQPGSWIFVLGWVLDDTRVRPENIVGYNLILMNAYEHGQAYTETEYRTWLEDAGFEEFERHPLPDGSSILRATRSG
ncbi:MAG: methyltransferase domain-containing protein [Chloroflexota bacterium]|nr:MAG: methyltransferase domain-containing protein [Chloroflexota bacterium]